MNYNSEGFNNFNPLFIASNEGTSTVPAGGLFVWTNSTEVTSGDLFNISADGYVGIGQLNTGASLTEISDVNGYGVAGTPLLTVDNTQPPPLILWCGAVVPG